MESAGGRQPGVDNSGLIQPQERVPSRLREKKPSVHLGFAQGGCVGFPLVGSVLFRTLNTIYLIVCTAVRMMCTPVHPSSRKVFLHPAYFDTYSPVTFLPSIRLPQGQKPIDTIPVSLPIDPVTSLDWSSKR